MLNIKEFLQRFYFYLKQRTTESEYLIKAFGWFGLISFPLFYFFNIHYSSHLYNNLPIRIVAAFLCLLLILQKFWPTNLKAFFPVFWHFTILICMPCFFTYMLLMNQFSTPWLFNTITTLFLFMLLVDWFMFFIMLFVGIIVGGLAFYFVSPGPLVSQIDPASMSDVIGMYFITIIMGLVFVQNRSRVMREKYRGMKIIAGNIAHDLRTPLASILLAANLLDKTLPTLIESYENARDEDLAAGHIRKLQLQHLDSRPESIAQQVKFSNMFIDMMLSNLHERNVKFSRLTLLNSAAVIHEFEQNYPFTSKERAVFYTNIDGAFDFVGDKTAILNVFNNLMSNALYYIKAAGKGEILISFEQGEDYNYCHFKDTGAGASKKVLSKLFDGFFSTREGGTGLGLVSCKRIMLAHHGDIKVKSIEGEYMQFTLLFPKVS